MTIRTFPRRYVAALLAAFGAAGIAGFSSAGQKSEIEIILREKRVDQPTLQGLTLVFVLDVKNNTGASQSLARYDYRLIVGQTDYIRLQTNLDAPIAIPARSEMPIAFPVKFTYDYLYANVAEAMDKDRLSCNLVGGMTFLDERRREKRIPIAFSGDFPIFRGFDAGSVGIEAKDLTLGGAEIVYTAVLRNLNGVELRPVRLTYKVSVAGKLIAEGTKTDLPPLSARGEVTFSVPLLLDFWEIGRDVFQALDNPPAPVRLQGELEAEWDWGTLRLSFDKTERTPVVKKSAGR